MTLDEAIKHCLEVAEQNETQADKIGRQLIGSAIDKYATDCRECAADHRQLAEWLTELKEAKRLLKAAVEDMKTLVRCDSVQDCLVCKYQLRDCDGFAFEWKHMEDVNNLINPIE